MNNKILKSLLGATCLSLAIIGSANAGGFSRGNADTDILYEEGGFNMRSSATFVSPTKKLSKAANPEVVGTDIADSYVIPSVAFKLNLTERVRCAGTMTQNNGGASTKVAPTGFYGTLEEEFTTTEYGLTCGVNFEVGPGRAWLLGGGFSETFDYHRIQDYSFLNANFDQASLDLKSTELGYRVGVAYDIPDIALRGELMYRSGTTHSPDGKLNLPNGVFCQGAGLPANCLGNPFASTTFDATGAGRLPQSVELSLQSGIAPGWLAFGSVKWSDWSVTETLDVLVNGNVISQDEFYWRDGWTVTGGVGHAFNERISGVAALTWDRGVATGYDLSGDTLTLSLGGSVKDKWGGELRGGLGLTYISSAEETAYGLDPITGLTGNTASDSGYAVAFSLGYAIKW